MKALLAAVMIAAGGGGSWLDVGVPAGWNAGSTLPKAPAIGDDLMPGGRCARDIRPPRTGEEKALHAAGWIPLRTWAHAGGISIVLAQTDADGMCRPLNFNAFVFVHGTYAGTLSPVPMDSRTDGVVEDVQVRGASRLEARFARYTPKDALCCPSATTTVRYTFARKNARTVVAPVRATTAKNT